MGAFLLAVVPFTLRPGKGRKLARISARRPLDSGFTGAESRDGKAILGKKRGQRSRYSDVPWVPTRCAKSLGNRSRFLSGNGVEETARTPSDRGRPRPTRAWLTHRKRRPLRPRRTMTTGPAPLGEAARGRKRTVSAANAAGRSIEPARSDRAGRRWWARPDRWSRHRPHTPQVAGTGPVDSVARSSGCP